MSSQKTVDAESIIVVKLSLERCQQKIAHLHAMIHLCGANSVGLNEKACDSFQDLLKVLECEISSSAAALVIAD
jgi:hypothetical protein